MRRLLTIAFLGLGTIAAGAQIQTQNLSKGNTSPSERQTQFQENYDRQQLAAFKSLESDNENAPKVDDDKNKPNRPPEPVFAIAATHGPRKPDVCLKIIEPDLWATVYYTTDGSSPSATASIYSGPFCVKRGTKIRAVAIVASALPPSETAAHTFR